MLVRSFFLIASISAATVLSAAFAVAEPKSAVHQSLKDPSEFESIGDQADRSRAIFAEIGKLLTHPRCMSCHPAGDHPLQGADHHEHMPRVWRGDTGHLGTHCEECHTEGFDMKITLIAAVSVLVLTSSMASAQNASTGATTTSGDSAVSPATGNPIDANSNGTNRPSQGAGVNSGVLNNGTTGDTIGTGLGTSSKPSAGQGTTSPLTVGGRKD
jgi:hypothetical protein